MGVCFLWSLCFSEETPFLFPFCLLVGGLKKTRRVNQKKITLGASNCLWFSSYQWKQITLVPGQSLCWQHASLHASPRTLVAEFCFNLWEEMKSDARQMPGIVSTLSLLSLGGIPTHWNMPCAFQQAFSSTSHRSPIKKHDDSLADASSQEIIKRHGITFCVWKARKKNTKNAKRPFMLFLFFF